jgi:UDP-N-acetylglucosamine acyltransferase
MAPVSSKASKRPGKARIHPTAIVSPEASLGEGVEIGPYCVVGPQAKLGKGTQLVAHVYIEGDATLGRECVLYPGVSIGTPAQAVHPVKSGSKVLIGDKNVFREHVTVNQSMLGASTVIGDRNYFMTGAHVGHDSTVGHDVVMANSAALGGHVQVGDRVVIGGLVGVHQFVRIGTLSIIGACSKMAQDAAPFSIYDGQRASFRGMNAVGLRRAGYGAARMAEIKKALRLTLHSRENISKLAARARETFKGNADVRVLLDFIESSKRGVSRSAAARAREEE